jgi:hypothetical protein
MTTTLPREWSFLAKPQQKATERMYCKLLRDIPFAVGYTATEQLLATAKRMPTPADIREVAMQLMHGDVKPGGEAWGGVVKAIEREGISRTPGKDFIFADSITAKCVASLSWKELCRSDNRTADRARFIELYDQLARTYRREQNVSQLPAAQRFRALQAAQTKSLTDASARSDSAAPHRADFSRLLPTETEQ